MCGLGMSCHCSNGGDARWCNTQITPWIFSLERALFFPLLSLMQSFWWLVGLLSNSAKQKVFWPITRTQAWPAWRPKTSGECWISLPSAEGQSPAALHWVQPRPAHAPTLAAASAPQPRAYAVRRSFRDGEPGGRIVRGGGGEHREGCC